MICMAVVDVLLDVATSQKLIFPPTLLRITHVVRILRAIRGLKLAKALIPVFQHWLDTVTNRRLWLAYDLGKGYVMAQEDVIQLIDDFAFSTDVAGQIHQKSNANRFAVLKALGQLQTQYPTIVTAVKTRHAARSTLNHNHRTLRRLQREGLLDDRDAHYLRCDIEKSRKQQETGYHVCMEPMAPDKLLRNIPWLNGLGEDSAIDFLLQHADLQVGARA